MSPKIQNINGKTYLVHKDGEAEEVVEPVVETPAEAPAEAPAESPVEAPVEVPAEAPVVETPEENLDEAASKAADAIVAQLPIDQLNETLKALNKHNEVTAKAKEVLGGGMTKADVAKMTSREKITKFFQAAVQSNHVALKALSEGTAADGGYLFPKLNLLGN